MTPTDRRIIIGILLLIAALIAIYRLWPVPSG